MLCNCVLFLLDALSEALAVQAVALDLVHFSLAVVVIRVKVWAKPLVQREQPVEFGIQIIQLLNDGLV